MKKLTIEQAREFLKSQGFFTDNLWHVDDVKTLFNVDDTQAQEVLLKSLKNDNTMEQIWFAIKEVGMSDGLSRKIDLYAVIQFRDSVVSISENTTKEIKTDFIDFLETYGGKTDEDLESLTPKELVLKSYELIKSILVDGEEIIQFHETDEWEQDQEVKHISDEISEILLWVEESDDECYLNEDDNAKLYVEDSDNPNEFTLKEDVIERFNEYYDTLNDVLVKLMRN